MAFRIITGLCLLALLYAGFEWGRLAWASHDANTPPADFLVQSEGDGPQVVAFIDYRCGNCAAFYKALDDLRDLHPNTKLTIRPLFYVDEQSEKPTRLALAAGLEGHFQDVNKAFMEKGGEFPENFLRETISLYGMDYDALLSRMNSKEVDAIMRDNTQDAQWLGVVSVPSLMIGNVYYPAPAPLEDFNVSQILPLLAPAR